MLQEFVPGDFLIFQLEAGYGILRLLDVEHVNGSEVWHIKAYRDLFLDPEMADAASARPETLVAEIPHVALTNRAFESTQVSRLGHAPLAEEDLVGYRSWKGSNDREVSDRSIRLLLGLR